MLVRLGLSLRGETLMKTSCCMFISTQIQLHLCLGWFCSRLSESEFFLSEIVWYSYICKDFPIPPPLPSSTDLLPLAFISPSVKSIILSISPFLFRWISDSVLDMLSILAYDCLHQRILRNAILSNVRSRNEPVFRY
jgi:hypothetical protein